MACLPQPDAALVVQGDRMGPKLPTKGGSCCDHIQLRKGVKSGKNGVGLLSDTAGKLTKNPHDFSIDLTIGDLDRIVQIDQLPRLQKNRGATGRYIVDNARDTPLHVSLDGNDIPALPLGKVAFLESLFVAL